MKSSLQTQITPNNEPVTHWGVLFVHENVVSDYGPGDDAKAAAEDTVQEWADTAYPARLVSQVVLPWSAEVNTKVPLVLTVQAAASDARAVVALREWLVDNMLDEAPTQKTGLAVQVPLIKRMRKASGIAPALELLNTWLKQHDYTSSDECFALLREKLTGDVIDDARTLKDVEDRWEEDGHNIKLDL